MSQMDKPRLSTVLSSLKCPTSFSHLLKMLGSLNNSFAKNRPPSPPITAACLLPDSFEEKSANTSFPLGHDLG